MTAQFFFANFMTGTAIALINLKVRVTPWTLKMKNNIFRLHIACSLVFLLSHVLVLSSAAADQQAAMQNAMGKALATIVELDEGIEEAEEYLRQIEERKNTQEYQIAKQIKEDAERMLAEARKHRVDSEYMANGVDNASDEIVVSAASYTSRAQSDTARVYARIGLLFLKALKFAAAEELDCAERTNDALKDKQRTWRNLQKIVNLAHESYGHAKSALAAESKALEEAEISTKLAKECIAFARELNLQLENFEDICNDFLKEWEELLDDDDDEVPSPV
jgi:hypothetical protein